MIEGLSPHSEPNNTPRDVLKPAAANPVPGRNIVSKVDALIEAVGQVGPDSLSYEQSLQYFRTGRELAHLVTEYNGFAGRSLPSEDSLATLIEAAEEVADTLCHYEAAAAAIFQSPETSLASFAKRALESVRTDPAIDGDFNKEVGEIAAKIASDFFKQAHAGYLSELAANFTAKDINERVLEVASLAQSWLTQETSLNLQYLAACGAPELEVRNKLRIEKFATRYPVADYRARFYAKIESADNDQDQALMAKLKPVLSSLISKLKEPAGRDWFKGEVPELWQDRISDWEMDALRAKLIQQKIAGASEQAQ